MAAETNYVPTNGLVFWMFDPGATAIPANWSEDTAFRDKFLQGHATTAGTNSGGTHLHSLSHTHTGNTHTHTFSANSITPTYATTRQSSIFGVAVSPQTHNHGSTPSNTATITYQNTASNSSSTDALPPYVTAVVIKPDDAVQDIPDDAICFTDEAAAPTGFHITDGAGGTTDYDGKYVRGSDVGGSTAGSATHGHTDAGHDHQDNSHRHDYKTCGNPTLSSRVFAAVTASTAPRAHHSVRLNATTLSDVNSTVSVIDNATWEPKHTTLLGIQNTSGGATTPLNVVVGFIGAVGDIPSNWSLMDGTGSTLDCTDSQVKISKTAAAAASGSDSHTHNSTTAHGHTHAGSHNHATSINYLTEEISKTGTPTVTLPSVIKSHNSEHTWTIGITPPTMQNNTFTTDSVDGRSAYRTVLFIKKTSLATVSEQPAVFYGCNF